MSLVPEFIFQTVISRGITTLRNDSRYIDQLFKNLSQKDQDQLRGFIRNNQIHFAINYPRQQLSVPAIVVLLKNENESTAYLGDSMGMEVPSELSYDDYNDFPEILGGTGSITSLSGYGEVVFGPHKVLSATNNTVTVSSGTLIANCFLTDQDDGPHTIHILAGTGVGQIREIVANSDSVIMVSANWTTNPDSTSIFEVRKPADEVVGEPSALYDRYDNTLERRGALYLNRYQIQLIASTQEQTIYLYAILKAIFTLSRLFMEGQGIINFKMSGTDFVNRPEYIPDYAFMRALNMEFEHPFNIYEQLQGLAESFILTLCAEGDEVIQSTEVTIGNTAPTITGP